MTAAVGHKPSLDHTDAQPVLDVDGLTVDIRTINGTVRAVNDVSFTAFALTAPAAGALYESFS